MIASNGIGASPLRLRGLVLAFGAALLPLGFTLAQPRQGDIELVRNWIESGVNSAYLTREQATVMLSAVERDFERRAMVAERGAMMEQLRYIERTERETGSRGGAPVDVAFEGESGAGSLQRAEQEFLQRKTALEQLSVNYTPSHPEVIAARASYLEAMRRLEQASLEEAVRQERERTAVAQGGGAEPAR